MGRITAPALDGDAAAAVAHRGSHLQIIASAGSGKTEVVAQRVAALVADGVDPSAIVAFTFTERAAAELKERVEARIEERLGPAALDRMGAAFIGTIHAYCFRLLQRYVPRYETYDVLDDARLTAFLTRESSRLGIKNLSGTMFRSISDFVTSLQVVENELIAVEDLDDPFRSVAVGFLESLEKYRLLTYGQLVARAVEALGTTELAAAVHADLRHLVVDEYQDVNPAQEALIRRLTGEGVDLCVVGDDDQAIYQWRGSDVANIVGFAERYPGVATFRITTNRRSREPIVTAAASFVESVPDRLPKQMTATRPEDGASVVVWEADTESDEARRIAEAVLELNAQGTRYRDIAVLVRSRAAYPALLAAFDDAGIPVQPGGRTGLFDRPEAQLFGRTYAWLVDHDWNPGQYGRGLAVDTTALFDEYRQLYALDRARDSAVRRRLGALKADVASGSPSSDLVRDFYGLLGDIGCADWDTKDPLVVARLGTLARCSTILADYEAVRRRARLEPERGHVGGQFGDTWFYTWLAIHLGNYAKGAYEDFDGEPSVDVDAVDVTTVHRAKGLEWPVVFVPSLTKRRFPSSRTGQRQTWHVPRHLFDSARYEGCDADERRLFYVAMTRARDWVSLSRHERLTKRVAQSPYHAEVQERADLVLGEDFPLPPPPASAGSLVAPEQLVLTFSELSAYQACGFSYRMRSLLGFQPTLAPELGYGKAVHHVMRAVAEHTQKHGRVPSAEQLDALFGDEFFLPAANPAAHQQMTRAARRLVDHYVEDRAADLHRVWQTERPFELHLPTVTVTGRADVVLDHEDGVPTSMAIVDYKTSTTEDGAHDLQLQVYAEAGLREGLDVRAAYVHDLKAGVPQEVDVTGPARATSTAVVLELVDRLRARDFSPNPGPACRRCDVRTLCADGSAAS